MGTWMELHKPLTKDIVKKVPASNRLERNISDRELDPESVVCFHLDYGAPNRKEMLSSKSEKGSS